MYNKNNPSCRSRTPGTPEAKFLVQTVDNYQSLTVATKTYIPGVTWHVNPLLDLTVINKDIFNWKFARSRFVGDKFLQNLQGQFPGIQFLIFDLKSSRDLHCLRSLGKLLQTLAPTKDAASTPYLTEWTFLDFSLSSFPLVEFQDVYWWREECYHQHSSQYQCRVQIKQVTQKNIK